MNPLPPEVIARWSKMWPKDCYLARPWWGRVGMTPTRCDGLIMYHREFADLERNPDPRGAIERNEPYDAAMARIDTAHPLPVPGPMCGQIWAWPEYGPQEVTITGVCREVVHANGQPIVFPPPGAILVYGPSCYGVVPWGPA